MEKNATAGESRCWTDPSPEATRASCTRLAESLATALDKSVSKRALAEALASKAVARGVVDGLTDAQITANLMAELRKWEQIAALRRSRKVAEELTADVRAQGYSNRHVLEAVSHVNFKLADADSARRGGES